LTDPAQALTILKATIPIWQGTNQPGYNDSAAWQSMEQFLVAQKMIKPVDNLAQAYTNQAIWDFSAPAALRNSIVACWLESGPERLSSQHATKPCKP